MENLTLKQMRYFVAVMASGHFGRAADVCAISQPALSVQIKTMEAQFQTPLFERTPKGVRPTGFAETLLPKVQAVLASVDQMADLAALSDDGAPHRLRMGVIPTIAPYTLPRMIQGLAGAYPTMDLQVMEAMTPKLMTALEAGRIDMAVLALPVGADDIAVAPLLSEPFVLVRPMDQRHNPVPPADMLAKERLLLLEEGHCFRDQALAFCSLQSAQVRHGLDATNLSTLVQMVAAGLGVTLIPAMAVGVETNGASVSVAAFCDPVPSRDLGVIWRKSHALADVFSPIAQTIRRSVAV